MRSWGQGLVLFTLIYCLQIWSSTESTCQCRSCRRQGFDPWVGKIPWRRKWHPTPVFLPGKSRGQRSLVGFSPWSHRGEHDLATKQNVCSCCCCTRTGERHFFFFNILPNNRIFFKVFFLMCTTFSVFTEFVTTVVSVLCFQFFLSRGMWDLSSPTRDQTHTPCTGR